MKFKPEIKLNPVQAWIFFRLLISQVFELCITVMVSHVFMEFVLFHLVEKSQCFFFFTQVESAPNKKKLLSSRYRCLGSSLRGILPARQCTRSNRFNLSEWGDKMVATLAQTSISCGIRTDYFQRKRSQKYGAGSWVWWSFWNNCENIATCIKI